MQSKFCPCCITGYMLFMDQQTHRGWKKCPTCGWCEDKNGENEVTKELDKRNLPKEAKKHWIQNWRKMKV